ncbi:MAG: YqhG family protein [Bacillota bacterium]
MALSEEEAALRRFVLVTLRLTGAVFSMPDEELVLATVRVVRPGGFFSPPRVEEEDLQLVFSREGAERHPSAELVSPGSPRLEWFINQARARGFLARGFYAGPCDPQGIERAVRARLPLGRMPSTLRLEACAFAPFFLAVLRLSFTAAEKNEELLPIVLDLREGSADGELAARLRAGPFVNTPPVPWPLLRRRLSWREVWRRLQGMVKERVAARGTDWCRSALERLPQEMAVLRRYYLATVAEGADPETARAEYLRRAEELVEMWAPSVRVALANAALVYLPRVRFSVLDREGRVFSFIYEPVREMLRWEGEPPSPGNP